MLVVALAVVSAAELAGLAVALAVVGFGGAVVVGYSAVAGLGLGLGLGPETAAAVVAAAVSGPAVEPPRFEHLVHLGLEIDFWMELAELVDPEMILLD